MLLLLTWGTWGCSSEPPPPASCEAALQAVLASAACQAHPEELRRFLAPVAPYTGGQGKLREYKYHDTQEAP